MKTFKKGLAWILALVACLVMTTTAFADEYTVVAGGSIPVAMTQTGDGGIDGTVSVSGGATATYSSSENGGVTGSGVFYLYNSGSKTVTATVTAPTTAQMGDVYTVTFAYTAYDANGSDAGSKTVVKTVTVGDKNYSPDGAGTAPTTDTTPDAEPAEVDFSALDAAVNSAKALGEGNKLNSLWLALADALERVDALRESGDQDAVNALAEEINLLVQQILEASNTAESCNIKSHKVWPILFFISFAVNIVLAVVIAKTVGAKKRSRRDSTPLVDYDISDDE